MACAKHMTAAATGEDGPWCWGRCGSERVAAEEKVTAVEGPWCWGRFGSERFPAISKVKEAEPSEDPLAFLPSQGKEVSDESVEQEAQRILLEQPVKEEQVQGIHLEQAKCTDAPPSERRISPNLVNFLLSLKREVPTIDHLDELTGIFPPEWIEKRRQEHKERVALYNQIDDDMELFQARLRKELKDNGYIKAKEVDADSVARFTKLEAWGREQFAKSEKIEYNESEWED
jgi:hypothetical protein